MTAVTGQPPSAPANAPAFTWIKADLHLHTAEDPLDEIDYTAMELLEYAHELGFRALAVTLHDKVFDDAAVFARAEALGILLIPAAELRIEGADAVILNIGVEEAAQVRSFEDLRRLRAGRGDSLLVVAPHPFYRLGGSIGSRIEDYLDCFDAIEFCHFHVPLLNPNAPAVRLAERSGKPLLATSDAHRRRFFGQNFSLLAVENSAGAPTVAAVFAAIRADRIQRVSPSGGVSRLMALLFFLFFVHPILVRLPGSKRMQTRKGRRDATPSPDAMAARGPAA